MPSLPQPLDSGETLPPNCPICHQRAILWGRTERAGVTEANFCCPNDHGWLTKWVTP